MSRDKLFLENTLLMNPPLWLRIILATRKMEMMANEEGTVYFKRWRGYWYIIKFDRKESK